MSKAPGARQGVLSDAPKGINKTPKKSKAAMHFANAALPPLPKIEYPKTSGCLSPVSRPLKPPEELLPDYNPDNSFSQIERVTQHIGKIVSNYEEKMEDDSQKMRADFDMQFASSMLQPTDIVKQSQKIVDELLSKNRELKETQNSLMDGISLWLKQEEQTLQTATQPIDVPIVDDEVIQKLDSNTKNETALKAVSIHTDIVSKSIMQIRKLENKIMEQEQTIKALKEENAKKVISVQRRIDSKLDEATKKELDEAKKTIARLEATNKEQQERIEKLIVDSIQVNTSRSSNSTTLAANFEASEKDVLIEKLKKEISDLKEENTNVKTTVRLTQNEKEFLQSRITSLEEQIKTDRKKFDLQFRELINANADKSGKAGKDTASLKMIQTLRTEIGELQEKMNKQKQEDQQNQELEIQRLRNEFEERELTFKQKMALKYASKNHRADFEDFKNNEMQLRENMKRDHDLEIEKLKNDHQAEMNSTIEDFTERLNEMKKKLDEAEMSNVDQDTAAKIEKITTDYEKRAIQLESDFNQRMQNQREEFVRFKAKIDKDIEEKDNLIQQLSEQLKNSNSEADMYKLAKDKTEQELAVYKQLELEKSDLIIPETNELPKVDIAGLAGEIRQRVESEFLKQRMAFESALKNRMSQQRLDQEKEFDQKLSDQEKEYETKIYNMETDYKDQIAQLMGQIDGMKMADRTNNLQAQTAELDARIKALEIEKEHLLQQNKALAQQNLDDVTKAQIDQLLIETEEKQKEIDNLQKRLKDLKERQRYVSPVTHDRPILLTKNAVSHMYFDNSRDVVKKDLSVKTEICLSMPPTKEIDSSKLPPTLINQLSNTDPPLLQDAETITNNTHFQQLRICLDRSEGYVFVEVPENEGKSEESTARSAYTLSRRSSLILSQPNIHLDGETNSSSTEELPIINSSKPRRNKEQLRISINEEKGSIVIEKPEIIPPPNIVHTEIVDGQTQKTIRPQNSSILIMAESKDSINIDEQSETTQTDVQTNEPVETNKLRKQIAISDSSNSINIKLKTNDLTFTSEGTVSISPQKENKQIEKIPEVKSDRQIKTPELENPIPFNSLQLRPLQSSVEVFDLGKEANERFARRQQIERIRKMVKIHTVQASVEPKIDVEVNEKSDTNEGHFTKVYTNILQHYDNVDVSPASRANISCQIDIIETPKHKILKFIPPMEIFSLLLNEISPEQPPEVYPAEQVTSVPKTEVLKLVTAAGDVIEFPPRPLLSLSDDKNVIDVGQNIVAKEAKTIGKNLELVMSEMQSIQEELDTTKKDQMMNTLGKQLDIEKDNLISQLKERVTELEQLQKKKISLQTSKSSILQIQEKSEEKFEEKAEEKSDKINENENDDDKKSVTSKKLELSTTMSVAEEEPAKQVLEINPVMEISRNEEVTSLASEIQWTYDKNEKGMPTLSVNQTEEIFISAEPPPQPKSKRVTVSLSKNNNDEIRKQQEEIDKLKRKIEELQNAKTPQQMKQVVGDINDSLQVVEENADEQSNKLIQLTGTRNKNKSSLTVSTGLNTVMKDAEMISTDAFDAFEESKNCSLEAAKQLNSTIEDFSKKIGSEGATPTEQVQLVKKVKDIAAVIGKTPEAPSKTDIKELYAKALEEIKRQEDLVDSLRREIVNLKQFSSDSSAFVKVQQVEKELNGLFENRSQENNLFSNYQDAATYIRSMADQIKNDGSVASAGATSEVEQLKKLMNQGQPQWFTIKDLLGKIREKMAKDIQKSLNEELIHDLTQKLDELTKENDDLHKERIQTERDRKMEREKARIEYQKLNELYKNAQNYNELLLKIQPKDSSTPNVNDDEKEIYDKLQESQIKEKQYLEQLQEKIEQNSKLQQENLRLEGVLKQQEESFNKLFQQSADNQADKLMAGIRLEELLKEDEILRKKILVLEGIREDLNKQIGEFTSKLGDSQDIINKLRSDIIKLQDQLVNQDVAGQKKIVEELKMDPKTEGSRMVRLYQSKMDNMQQLLESRGREIIQLGFRRANDQKEMLLLKAEINRLKRELKFQSMRYNTSKEDAEFARKSIAMRDEVIREQKREIARLRSLIERFVAMKQIQALDSKEGESLINEVLSSRGRLKYAALIAKRNQNKPSFSKYDSLLQRDRQHYINAEAKRREFQERQEKQNMRILQDVALLARENELTIPETVVMQMMPKPKPSTKISAQQAKKEYVQMTAKEVDEMLKADFPKPINESKFQKEPSYADRLRAIGENQDKYPPEVVRSMLVAARHGKVVVPASTFNKEKAFPVITGKQLSTK